MRLILLKQSLDGFVSWKDARLLQHNVLPSKAFWVYLEVSLGNTDFYESLETVGFSLANHNGDN